MYIMDISLELTLVVAVKERRIKINTFRRLLRLYKNNKSSGKTPLEDFVTEVLAGILDSDAELLRKFTAELMEVQGERFTISTQKRYYLNNDFDCIVDIVIENEKSLIFLENKVESCEGFRQLDRYKKVLMKENRVNGKSVHLRYCTKYYDKKQLQGVNFKQLRWMDIFSFLSRAENKGEIIEEYLEFLRSEGMNTMEEFNFQDMLVLSSMNSTISKVQECLDKVKGSFESYFDKPSKSKNERGVWRYKVDIFGDKSSQVYLGFRFFDDGEAIVPTIICGIFARSSNNRFREFTKHVKNYARFQFEHFNEEVTEAYFEEQLSSFLSKDNQFDSIEKWFIDKLEVMQDFREHTEDLDWTN